MAAPLENTGNQRSCENVLPTDITSIINAFEENKFITRTPIVSTFSTDILSELDNILHTVSSTLPLNVRTTIQNYKKSNEQGNELLECLVKTKLIRKGLSKINNDIRRHLKFETNRNKPYQFKCNICHENIPLNYNKWVWKSLQEHEHIECSLAQCLINKDNFVINAHKGKDFYNVDSANQVNGDSPVFDMSTSSTSTSLSDNSVTTKQIESLLNKMDIGRHSQNSQTNVQEIDVGEHSQNSQVNRIADAQVAYHNNFKFNFQICYHASVEKQLYPKLMMEQVRAIDNIQQYTIQCKSPHLFACLLCVCEVPANVNVKAVLQHVRGHKHSRRKINKTAIDNLTVYHQQWLKQELMYQAHQIYFLPHGTIHSYCLLCQNQSVRYEELQIHIQSDLHKAHVLKFLEHGISKHSFYLLEIQTLVYNPNQLDAVTSESNTAQRSYLRTKTNMDNTSESDSEDSDTTPEGVLPEQNSRPNQSQSNHSLNQNNSPPNPVKPIIHSIVKAVLNPVSRVFLDQLENRYVPHSRFFSARGNQVYCHCCDVTIGNNINLIKTHILHPDHLSKSNMKPIKYKYFCDICNRHPKNELFWIEHLIDSKHKDRCANIGASRRNKLTEYECKTCKLVMFGDEITVKRHQLYQRSRVKKKKEIILPNGVKNLLKSEQNIIQESSAMAREANDVLLETNRIRDCCRALELALFESFGKCTAHPFGSRVSGLGNKDSDLDVFVDVGDMYLGTNHQDAESQEQFVKKSARIFLKKRDQFQDVNKIPTARTPIVQVFHKLTYLDCDLSFRHGLSVENTKFLRLCMNLQPVVQPLILMVKKWAHLSKLNEHITTYAFSIMSIFLLQVHGYLLPVHTLMELNPTGICIIDGWKIGNFQGPTVEMISQTKQYTGSLKDLLKLFFQYYGSFNYATDVVCPLLGHTIEKSLFVINPGGESLPPEMEMYVLKLRDSEEAECFRARSNICIQDPFDLSHNLTKACGNNIAEKLKTLCTLTAAYLANTP